MDEISFILALGSNLGDRRANLQLGLRELAGEVTIDAVSRIIESEPWGPVGDQGPYLNLVLRGHGARSPRELLAIAQAAETAAGRVRGVRYGPRTLDVDIIFMGDLVMDSPQLTIPHPEWAKRAFVRDLLPEVAGDMVDPRSGRPLSGPGRESPPALEARS
jgi:2-amino-4-hydroxy-6-hydroxymethyldihydropteridine diphosphokinase